MVCKDCVDKKVGCHCECELYKAFLVEHAEQKKQMELFKLGTILRHRVGQPGICLGEPPKRRTRQNSYR